MRGKENMISTIDESFIGRMVMYFYDPKTKDKMPYYDTFPLGIIVDADDKGFYSLNLHYLSPYQRAILMDRLYETLNNTLYNETTRLQITYELLKNTAKLNYYKPCFKRYLWGHVRSQFLNVPVPYWDIAVALPTARFQKQKKETVWEDSANSIMGIKKPRKAKV